MSITVSIVEDDPEVRNILTEWINQSETLRCKGSYSSVESALAHLPKESPDVVVIDINLSGQSGIHCVRTLKPKMPKTQFLVLTVYDDTDHIFDALKAGASGYLLKRTPREELLAAVQQVFEGGSPMTSYIARTVVSWFQQNQSPSKPESEAESLSPREREVLRLLGRGFTYKEIAEHLGISVPTVTTHVHRIYQKLHVRSRAQAVALFAPFPE